VEKYGADRQATDGIISHHVRLACWIAKAADTHLKYLILTAFSWHLWLHKCASMLHYMYIVCLVEFYMFEYTIPYMYVVDEHMQCEWF